MAGDRARVSYDPSRKWRGVVAQQGRVTVEADLNEAAEIDAQRDRQVTLDVVGPAGTPDGGYAVTVKLTPQGDLLIDSGTLYLGGERLDIDPPGITYSEQADWLDNSADPLYTPPAIPAAGTFELVYLLASEQEVSAVEDPALADVALGGPDTMQRRRILQRIVRTPSPAGTCGGSSSTLTSALASQGLQLNDATMTAESAAALQVTFTTPTGPTTMCQPVATGGYLGAENQLIRVMVTSIADGVPTIVWGFDDASFLYRVQTVTPDAGSGTTTLTLASAPVDSFHFPVTGQAVELLRDAAVLTDIPAGPAAGYIASPAGLVSTLTAAYDPATMRLVISGPPPADYDSAATPQPYLRVWQGTAAAQPGQATPLGDTGAAVTLTSSTGTFHVGDFWRFALRPIQPGIVYPARYREAAQPPDGPRTWACPIAVITWGEEASTVSACIPPFSDLVELTAKGSCCTVDVSPSDVNGGASLQALLESYANQEPVTVCLEPGTYTLPAPLILGSELNGLTLQACREGVILQAPSQPGAEFIRGLIVMGGMSSVAIRGIEFSPPLVDASTSSDSSAPNPFAGLSLANQDLLNAFTGDVLVAIGMSVSNAAGLTVADCTFNLPDANPAGLFGAGIFATEAMEGVEITGCTFQAPSPLTPVLFNELAAGTVSPPPPPPYQVTFGYLQVPGIPVVTSDNQKVVTGLSLPVLHDAAIERCLFDSVTASALAIGQLGTLRIDQNTVRESYAGFWLVSIDNPNLVTMFDQFAQGVPAQYGPIAANGAAAVVDRVIVIATAMGQVLPANPPLDGVLVLGTIPVPPPPPVSATSEVSQQTAAFDLLTAQIPGPAFSPQSPPAITGVDTGISVSLRLDFRDCQIDAIVAGVNSGAGLLVLDLTTDAGSAVIHGNRIRSMFPFGETALLTGLGDTTVTGNIVANEVQVPAPPPPIANPIPVKPIGSAVPVSSAAATTAPTDSFSLVLGPAFTALSSPAVAVTGNVFIDDVLLPARPVSVTISDAPVSLPVWEVLNTVVAFVTSATT